MSTTYSHIRMSAVDSEGNVRVMYPETTASDVTINRASNPNIPTTVTNLQLLANALTGSAFNEPINDSITSSERTWSSNKVNTDLTNINVYTDTDNELYFTDKAGTDHHISIKRAAGTATAAQVLSGYTFSNDNALEISGNMTNQGSKTYTINPGGSQTIPAGYHDGTGSVTANPNQNSTTYTYPANSTGGTVDMGVNNIYRYVNATNVYNKGKADGVTTHTGTYTLTENDFGTTKDMGVNHTYRYISVPDGGRSLDVCGEVIFNSVTRYTFGNLQENQSYYLLIHTLPARVGGLGSITGATYELIASCIYDTGYAYLYKLTTTQDKVIVQFQYANVTMPCVLFGEGLDLTVIQSTTSQSSTYTATVGQTFYLIDNCVPGRTGTLQSVTGATNTELSTLAWDGNTYVAKLRKLVATSTQITCTWLTSLPHVLLT